MVDSSSRVELIDTGFREFDQVLVGGFPRPGLVYVIGNPGVGKTTFALQYLVHRGSRGERGLYITTSEPLISIKTRFGIFKFYEQLIEQLNKRIIIMNEFLSIYGQTPESIQRFVRKIFEDVSEYKIKNIVVDSIAGLTHYLKMDEVRTLFTQLVAQTYDSNITLLVVDELPLFAQIPHLAMGEFLSDVLIMMDHIREKESGKVFTRFLVIKSRVSSALREPYAVQVTPDEGFQFIGPITGKFEKITW